MKLWLSPHDDDAELFGAFTLLREQPAVVIFLDSYIQADRGLNISARARRCETIDGLRELFGFDREIQRFGVPDSLNERLMSAQLLAHIRTLDVQEAWKEVYAPAVEAGGHPHHNLVGSLADEVFGKARVTHYLTYTDRGKSTDGIEVLPESGDWIARKLRALACHESQMTLDPRCGCAEHFMRGIKEYYQR